MKISKRFLPILAWFTVAGAGIQLANYAAQFHYTWNLIAGFMFLLGGVVAVEFSARLERAKPVERRSQQSDVQRRKV